MRKTAAQQGYLYLLRFDNDVIKAGRTTDPLQRSSRHRSDSGRFDLGIIDKWCSAALADIRLGEKLLLKTLGMIGDRTASGREYFRDIPFSVARYQAERVLHLRLKNCCCGTCVEPAVVHTTVELVGLPRADPTDETRLIFSARLPCGTVIEASSEDDFEPGEKERLRPGHPVDVELDPYPWHGRWTIWFKSLER